MSCAYHNRVVRGVVFRLVLVLLDEAGYWVGHAVAEMDASITEADACKHTCQMHLRARLEVILVVDSPKILKV